MQTMYIAIAKYAYNMAEYHLLSKIIDIVSYRHVIITNILISYCYKNCTPLIRMYLNIIILLKIFACAKLAQFKLSLPS